MRNRRGSILLMCYLVVALLLAYGSTILIGTLSEQTHTRMYVDLAHGFHLAEAGADEGLHQLRTDYNWAGGPGVVGNAGNYQVQVTQDGSRRIIMSTGTPTGNAALAIKRIVELSS